MKAARPKRRRTEEPAADDLSTPLWDRYYRALRQRLRLTRPSARPAQR